MPFSDLCEHDFSHFPGKRRACCGCPETEIGVEQQPLRAMLEVQWRRGDVTEQIWNCAIVRKGCGAMMHWFEE